MSSYSFELLILMQRILIYKNLDKSADFNIQGFTFSNQEFTSHDALVSFSMIGQCLMLDICILSLTMSKLPNFVDQGSFINISHHERQNLR